MGRSVMCTFGWLCTIIMHNNTPNCLLPSPAPYCLGEPQQNPPCCSEDSLRSKHSCTAEDRVLLSFVQRVIAGGEAH
jgi:hypothetical protein